MTFGFLWGAKWTVKKKNGDELILHEMCNSIPTIPNPSTETFNFTVGDEDFSGLAHTAKKILH